MLARRWRTILAITALVVGAVVVMTRLEGRVYDASATVVLDTPPGQSTTSAPSMPTEQQVGGSPAVARVVIRRLRLRTSPEALLRHVSVSVPLDSQVLKFSYSSSSPAIAQERAQAFAAAYLELRRQQIETAVTASTQVVEERIAYLSRRLAAVQRRLSHSKSPATTAALQSQVTTLTSQVVSLEQKLSDLNASVPTFSSAALIGNASRPTSPTRPRTMLNLTLGILGGIVLGLGIAALQEYTDDRIRGRRDLQSRLRVPVLGPVPVPRLRRRPHEAGLVAVEAPGSAAAESYRRLAVELLLAARTAKATSVVLTSAEALPAKAFVTANLGVVLARAGKRVVIVSCDAVRPTLEEVFDLPPHPGLTEVLGGDGALRDAIRATAVRDMLLLGRGAVHEAAAPLYITGAEDLVEMIRQEGPDVILVDAPAMVGVDDAVAIALAAACDGVVLVSQPSSSTATAVTAAREQLGRLPSTLLAGVLVEAVRRSPRRSPQPPSEELSAVGAPVEVEEQRDRISSQPQNAS